MNRRSVIACLLVGASLYTNHLGLAVHLLFGSCPGEGEARTCCGQGHDDARESACHEDAIRLAYSVQDGVALGRLHADHGHCAAACPICQSFLERRSQPMAMARCRRLPGQGEGTERAPASAERPWVRPVARRHPCRAPPC